MSVIDSEDTDVTSTTVSQSSLDWRALIDAKPIQSSRKSLHLIRGETPADKRPKVTYLKHPEREIQLDANLAKDEANHMNTINRNEFDSKLSATEARMDARVEKFSSEMNKVIAELKVDRADRDAQVNTAIAEFNGRLKPLEGLRSTVIITAVTSVLAIAGVILAAMSIYATSFDSGRNTANELQSVRQEFMQKQNNTDQSLKEISQSLKALATDLKKDNADTN